MSLVLTDSQKTTATVAFADNRGNPAKVQGPPAWSSSDETILGVTAADDGMSASIVAAGGIGTAQVNVKADADLGEGVVDVAGVLDIEVVSGQAVAANVSATAPVEQ